MFCGSAEMRLQACSCASGLEPAVEWEEVEDADDSLAYTEDPVSIPSLLLHRFIVPSFHDDFKRGRSFVGGTSADAWRDSIDRIKSHDNEVSIEFQSSREQLYA